MSGSLLAGFGGLGASARILAMTEGGPEISVAPCYKRGNDGSLIMTDAELRAIVLQKFYDRRQEGSFMDADPAWVPEVRYSEVPANL